MRCSRHVSDYSSTVGVCASCLRERLFTLIAAQVEENRRKTEDRRKAEAAQHHPPLVFPRSVSPYICRRSDDSSWHNNDRRFYSTPQLGPTHSASLPTTTTTTTTKKKRSGKFSLLSTLFRSSRSLHSEGFSDPRVSTGSLTSSTSSPMSSSSSSSWFSSLLSGRRKKSMTSTSRFDEAPPVINRRHRRTRDRGMSPTNVDREFEPDDGSGHSSESSPGWRKSAPATVPARRRGSNPNNRNVSGMAFCLSPLVRASPNNHWCQKDVSVPPVGISGEIARKPTTKNHLSTAASLCANRSRKLADMGRYSYKS